MELLVNYAAKNRKFWKIWSLWYWPSSVVCLTSIALGWGALKWTLFDKEGSKSRLGAIKWLPLPSSPWLREVYDLLRGLTQGWGLQRAYTLCVQGLPRLQSERVGYIKVMYILLSKYDMHNQCVLGALIAPLRLWQKSQEEVPRCFPPHNFSASISIIWRNLSNIEELS